MFQDLASIADIIGALGVMISLVFVGLQVMQANKQSRIAARQEQVVSTGHIHRMIADDSQLADIWSRAVAGQDITPSEQTRLVAYLMFVERMQEGLYWQYADGEIDAELWEAHRRHARAAQNVPFVVAFWKIRAKYFSERYQKFREEETAKVGEDRLRYDVMPAAKPEAKKP